MRRYNMNVKILPRSQRKELKDSREYRVKYAFKLYKEGEVSLWKAAELAQKSLWDMIGLMKKYKVSLNYDADELREDLKNKI